MMQSIKQKLTQLLGREPLPEEVQAESDKLLGEMGAEEKAAPVDDSHSQPASVQQDDSTK